MPPTSYQCPHCDRKIGHRPHLAGAKVQCSGCGGFYFEPTDPLPGVRPVKAESPDESAPMATLVRAPVLSPASSPSKGELTPPSEASSAETPVGGTKLRSSTVLSPYEHAGQKAVVITWSPENPTGAKIGTTKNLPKPEANDMILRVAVKLIKKRWPEIYPLLAVRLDKSFSED